MISSLRSASCALVVVDKAESSLITEPMIPLVHKWFVDLLKKEQTPFEPPPYVDLWNAVPAGRDSLSNPPDGFVRRRQLYEME